MCSGLLKNINVYGHEWRGGGGELIHFFTKHGNLLERLRYLIKHYIDKACLIATSFSGLLRHCHMHPIIPNDSFQIVTGWMDQVHEIYQE